LSTLLPLQFRGVDQAADPKAQPPGTLVRAENCAMDKARRLIKRRGIAAHTKATFDGGSAGPNLSTATHLLTRGSDLALVDPEFSRTYSAERVKWQKVGRPSPLRMTHRGLIDSTRSVSQVDVIAYGNLLVTVYVSGYNGLVAPMPNLYAKVEDIETGATVLPPVLLLEGAAWPRVHVSGTRAIFTCSDVNGAIWAGYLDMADFTHGAALVDATAAVFAPCDSVIVSPAGGSGPTLYIVYGLAAGTDRAAVAGVVLAFGFVVTIGPVAFPTASQVVQAVSIAATPAAVHILYAMAGSSSTLLRSVSPLTLASTVGPTTITNGITNNNWCVDVTIFDATRLLITNVGADSAGSFPWRMRTALRTMAAHTEDAASVRYTYSVIGMGKPFALAGRWYTLAVNAPKDHSLILNNPIPNASSLIVEIETAVSLTSLAGSPHVQMGTAENLTGWVPTRRGYTPSVAVVGGVVYVPAAYRNREPLNFQSIPIGWNLHRVEVASSPPRLAVAGPGGLCAGAAPFWFDGATTFPYGFATAPMIVELGEDATGGTSVIDVGSYTYVAVYEWRDANGVLHRSPASPPRTAAIATPTHGMRVRVACASLPQHQLPPYGPANAQTANPVSLALYRTTAGGAGVYYRLTLEPEYQVLLNDPTIGYVTLLDTKADADIGAGNPARPLATQPQLYTAEEADDVPPPALLVVASHRGRIAGIDGSKRTVWFTKDQTQDPQVAPGFNEAFTLSFASDKTALASLDEKLVVFGETTIDVVHGDGPDAAGNNNSWQIQGVQTDVGCVNPRSTVAGPMGVAFLSHRGLEMFGRDLTVSWIGKAVEDDLAAYPTITSAVLVADAHEIRFTCIALDGLTGIVLAWDYFHGIWFVRKYRDTSDTAAASVPFVDAALIGGVYTMLTAGGQVYQETVAHKLDVSTFVARTVELAWLSPSSAMAWHRVKDVSLLGTSVTDHDLELSIARDYATAYEQTKTFLAQSDATAIGPLEKCRVTLKNQKCRAMKLRVRELSPTAPGALSTGEGAIWEGLGFRVQTKEGPAKTNAAERG